VIGRTGWVGHIEVLYLGVAADRQTRFDASAYTKDEPMNETDASQTAVSRQAVLKGSWEDAIAGGDVGIAVEVSDFRFIKNGCRHFSPVGERVPTSQPDGEHGPRLGARIL